MIRFQHQVSLIIDAFRKIKDKKPILFLDYDGTLVSIRMNPEDAVPSKDVLLILNALKEKYEMWIVTGRSLKEIISFLGTEYNFIALHGAIESTPNGIKYNIDDFKKYRDICNRIETTGSDMLSRYPGLRLYNKDGNFLFHCGLMDLGLLPALLSEVEMLSEKTGMPVYNGKRIAELRIPGINKGIAIKKHAGNRPLLIAGDDKTDEDAFLEFPEAITIKVGKEETVAKYRLEDPDEVLTLLKAISSL